MPKTYHNLSLELDQDLAEQLQWLEPNYSSFHILRQSVDARRGKNPRLIYSVEIFGAEESPPPPPAPLERLDHWKEAPVLVVGTGPAGLFAALRLLERGIPCVIFEQGSEATERLKRINRFWRYGELDPRNNVGFGEGGAGLYSDGKLITRIKSPHIPYVMRRLVEFGAPEEILYLSNPHVGSDRIRRVIPKLRQRLLDLGGQIHFNTKVTELLLDSSPTPAQIKGLEVEDGRRFLSERVILACGHSSEDMFAHLHQMGVYMESKAFAVGLRVEHPQQLINQIQYRSLADHPKLGAANYKLAYHNKEDDRGIYSFCMCPGGYVLSSGTEPTGLVSNGMSNYNRGSAFANAAIVVSLQPNTSEGLFAGLRYRRELEARALSLITSQQGTKELPAQRLVDFLDKRSGPALKSSCPSGVLPARLDQLMGEDLSRQLQLGLEKFNRSMRGFITPEAQFHGVESRTSCPLRITRDPESLESLSHQGLFPCGEGAGYAGGITSAACDGIRIAEKIYSQVVSIRSRAL